MTYMQHLIKNWRVAFHALHDFFAHFIHGLIPAIKIRHHQPERKTGRWIPFDVPWYRCSECGAVRENKTFMEYYCPNCGADMRGEWE